jgi:hypothetical protein
MELPRRWREDGRLELGNEAAQNRRPKDDAREEFAYDSGLPKTPHQLRESAREQEEARELQQQDTDRVTGDRR